MLPESLVSTYLEYKKDTDSIASWLASTAKAAGFKASNLAGPPTQSAGGGRLKGKARQQAKKNNLSKPVVASTAKYTIRLRDFTVLAEYILGKAIAVPLSFQSTLDRAITARGGFGAKLEKHGSTVEPGNDAKHENFVDVLKHVRVILTSLMPAPTDEPSAEDDTLFNRFAGLTVYEPSEEFLAAPDIERPPTHEADPVDYAAETPSSFEDAMFALFMLMNDMNRARSTIKWVWKGFNDFIFDVVPAAVATNTTIELVRNMMDDIVPMLDKYGGLKKCLEKCYIIKCLESGFGISELTSAGRTKDNFNYDTYDAASETFYMAFRLVEAFQAVLLPGQLPLYKDGIFGTYDANSDRARKSGLSKFHDDRALTMPFFADLTTVVLNVPDWPVHDEALRGMKEMTKTGKIPLYLVFATQVFLDVTYTLGPSIEKGWQLLNTHTNFIANDVTGHLDYHANLKVDTWPASNDQMLKWLSSSIQWLVKDPIFKVQSRLFQRQGVVPNSSNLNRIFRMSPVLSGLVLYHFRFKYRDAGIAIANAWGSIQYTGHLYDAVRTSKLLPRSWPDMDIVKMLLGTDSFYAGGEEPKTLKDQFKKHCLQMGVSAAALANTRRKGTRLASKSGPRGINLNAPVSTMFEERYVNDSAVVLKGEDINRIVQISMYQLETDEETGETVLGKIEDEKVLKEKKKLQHELKRGSKWSSAQPRVSLVKLTELLVNSMQAETLEFSFPYMRMHRLCWQHLRAVRVSCDSLLRKLIGPDYLETENQLPHLVGYLLMLACGAEKHAIDLRPLQAAAAAVSEMLAHGKGDFIMKKILSELDMEIEIEEE
ncbi:hypothetical protein NLG97_g1197 [Lecanicillium saksenae]|uniref:Uncharacterized protein n=1 Tax=Lecanicillium saksenae TaxID=468837 RepID=A0ACC1R4E0_9HYPO|nr:hypothetical protein NLG97_g1197 [Lecanicillium saksenae]